MTPDRHAAWRRGRWSETLAAGWLWLKGYRLLARNLRCGRGSTAGELDLVVRRGRLVAFVEVKHRTTLAAAAAALGPAQRRRIERAAAAFLARHPDCAGCDLRFDLILVAGWGRLRHCPDAWRLGD